MRENKGRRLSFWRSSLLAVIVFGLGSISYGATFTNSSSITIPTGPANASLYPSPITVSGLSGTITTVTVTFNNFSHTFPDDLGIVVVGPTGAALLLADGCGEDVVSGVTFTLADSGATQLPDIDAWGPGTYKPAGYFTGDSFPAPGPLLAYNHPGPTGGNTATFASTWNGTAPNGTWNLFIRDYVAGDGGTITGGWTLNITTNAVVNSQHVIDMNGDGKTDYSLARNTGGGPGGQLTWFTQYTGVAGGQTNAWGLQGDEFTPGDYDGDNKTDVSIWRPVSHGWYTLLSTTGTLQADDFGLTSDDPSVLGDYNGDGKDDIAVYRAGASAGQPSFWYWRTVSGGPVFAVQWGQNGDFSVPGDFDGDGKNDFVVQRNAGGGQARFWRFFATGSSDSFVFGTPTDVILPGDYDGDGKTDICVIRSSGGALLWQTHPSGGGADTASFFGISASDFPAVGDYDGDGKSDLAVWRPNIDPDQNYFFVQGTTAGFSAFEWGQNGDYPVGNYNNH